MNQVSEIEYFEGVDIKKLVDDINEDLKNHMQLNELQDSITIEIRDFEYDISNDKVMPHTKFNIVYDEEIYNMFLTIHQEVDTDFKFHINMDKLDDILGSHSVFDKLADNMENKYGEDITRDTLQSVLIEIDKCVASDTSLILEEYNQKQEAKQKKSKSLGMSM
ncbi:hypothetical protein C1H69_22915 [Billgrantia endophytica]|uniref:Uncharacterized protein n=2 Tax=Billgrantia endophytica TaxID=2033802 RepID=A0A2N7TUG6_9GAMM|nr:hypothetical protein C1H69_22915 [Halomonas endophytica]